MASSYVKYENILLESNEKVSEFGIRERAVYADETRFVYYFNVILITN